MDAEHCEAKKHAYRQTQDGVVVSFVLHPNEVPEGLATAALGTRYMLAVVEIGDDEQPKKPAHRLSQKAALIGNEEAFRTFAAQEYPDRWRIAGADPAEFIRLHCSVASRKHLDTIPDAGRVFTRLCGMFEGWRRGL